jgi:bifunctional DNase/RNase
MELIEVQLSRVVIQQKGDQQYIYLKEKQGERAFPIVIGFNEVEEINRKLNGIQAPRPMTHDLVGRVVKSLGYRVARAVITELRDSTFFANLVLQPLLPAKEGEGEERNVDCRPSDAIALAVQTGAKIFVAREILDVVAN